MKNFKFITEAVFILFAFFTQVVFAAADQQGNTTIPNNTWFQIGINAMPPIGSTVHDIIGDDIEAPYGEKWVLYKFEADTNVYQKLKSDDIMLPGIGYWFIQITGESITIDMPEASTDVKGIQRSACDMDDVLTGCFEIPLQTNESNVQWQMIGYPFRTARMIGGLKVITNSGPCVQGCYFSQASNLGLVSNGLWFYDGATNKYDDRYVRLHALPWEGFWIATLPAAEGLEPKLLIPEDFGTTYISYFIDQDLGPFVGVMRYDDPIKYPVVSVDKTKVFALSDDAHQLYIYDITNKRVPMFQYEFPYSPVHYSDVVTTEEDLLTFTIEALKLSDDLTEYIPTGAEYAVVYDYVNNKEISKTLLQ